MDNKETIRTFDSQNKYEQGGYVRTSKSGRKFTYPSIEQRKQEIINKITMKTSNKPDG